jgi:hypothetical protein
MEPFPDEWELLALFATPPSLLDPEVPWRYNRLTFASVRGRDRIECVLEPGYGDVKFTWWHGAEQRLQLDLHWVRGLTVSTGGGRDALTLTFHNPQLLPLEIQLTPFIACTWGTTTQRSE